MIFIWTLIHSLAVAQIGFAVPVEIPAQADIDSAFRLILGTKIGRGICRDVMGADADALHIHLGISKPAAAEIAKNCGNAAASQWTYGTAPEHIVKLRGESVKARTYKVLYSDQDFPIESWTDPRSNSTTILTHSEKIPFPRLVQILSHEMAVYFDSKSNPLHRGADELPQLRDLKPKYSGALNPLFAISNPMQAHTLTYLRALQVEFVILQELVDKNEIAEPADLRDPYLQHLVSFRCQHDCIVELIENTRKIYLPFSLPLLAFSPHYRGLAKRELLESKSDLVNETVRVNARFVLNEAAVKFMRRDFTGDVVADLSRAFNSNPSDHTDDEAVAGFLQTDLWPLEKEALGSRFGTNGITVLEFMKRPLMSGYNISLSSGPRVRVRTGVIE